MQSDAPMRVIMGPVGCVVPETLVLTEYGPMPIWRIDRPMRVVSWNEKTCRYQLSWCGGAFPKGTDYLYQVTTPQGGFVASGHHLTYAADGSYQRVESLSRGQSLRLCSRVHELTRALCGRPMSLTDAPHSTRTAVGSLGHYAASARQHGLRLLQDEGIDQDVVQGQGGVQGSHLPSFRGVRAHVGGFLGLLRGRIRRGLLDAIADQPVLSVTRQQEKRSYWDMQVLDTNNYVTIDGAIHHNSGKSVGCCFEVVRRAARQAKGPDGFRRTRCAVIRQTVRQLSDTTIKTWLDWFPDGVCGHFMKTTKTYYLELGDIRCEVMFRALDDQDDVRNLLSLELTFAWFNECRDAHPDLVEAMSRRVGRFPKKSYCKPTWLGMWGDTNPPTMDTWWYYQMEKLDPNDGITPVENNWEVFKQPSGRSQEAENVENLPEGYYDTTGMSDEYIRVYIDGEYGLSSKGKPVWKQFLPHWHIADKPLTPTCNGVKPLLIGLDLGLTPAAVFGQLDALGRCLILDELVSVDSGILRFFRERVIPLVAQRFAGAPVLVVCDPAGVQRAQTDERSAIDIIKQLGFDVIPARTNKVTARINAVDDFLMRQSDGGPAFLMDRRCFHLKAAMVGGYRWHDKKPGVILKNEHSHVADALQYLCLHVSGVVGGTLPGRQRHEVKPARSVVWT